ncbi:MAG: DUF6125 family protein [Myxococcota bacterium]|jgi:hypothetical protein
MAAAEISKKDVREVLTKGWLTHDAMWFYSCCQELGIEKTNELNKSAIALMATIETKRMIKALGMQGETFDNFEKVRRFLTGAREFVIPEWMDFTWSMDTENIFKWQWNTCFAYEGVKRLGVADKYKCGVMYRIEGWLNALGVKYEMTPVIDGCLMHQRGECKGEFRLFFDN